MFIFRDRILQGNPYLALFEMSKLPNFKRDFPKFVHKMIANECKETCKKLAENEEEITREFVEKFSPDEKYQKLIDESPILMSALHGACCGSKFRDLQV